VNARGVIFNLAFDILALIRKLERRSLW